ncbi:putative phosphatase regulatory subunit-domain-containing protein [Lactarius psammicola]|nr:putative phosphatase regulatory subunit-domain-containing protein [Lactarius psammicola]
MSSTVLTTHGCLLPRDTCYSRNSSAAPLPLIPRRPSSVPNSRRVSPLVAPHADSTPAGVIFTRASPPTTPAPSNPASTEVHLQPPTPPDTIKGESTPNVSSSSVTPATQSALPRRVRGYRFPAIRPPEQSTPTPAKADSGSDTPVASAENNCSFLTEFIRVACPLPCRCRRCKKKKTGEPLKSSLKVKRTPARGSLTVITDPAGLNSSKSAPATPAHKGVRFNAQLEQVKHFLAEQKPIAVSRDGSPTDTSGTDSEFPPFIYGRDDDLTERKLVMHRVDVPTAPLLTDDTRDVVVESLDLVGTTIEGVVRVRNIAFEKWVAVRFTLDKWQTTSEVTARHKESLNDGMADRFMFSIKLADVLSRAEEKTLFLAVRYSVGGREIWDNNNSRNYQVRIVREKPTKPTMVATEEKPPMVSHADDIAVLRHKLEEVVKLGRPSDTIGGILAQHSRRRWGTPSPTPTPPSRDATPSFKSEGSLAARYDFATSLRTPWRAPAAPSTPSHARTSTYPSALPNSVPWPHSSGARPPCGSPRDAADGVFFFPERDSDSDDAISRTPSLRRSRSGSGSRNHTRGGAIELSHAPGVKRTPPTSPFGSPELPFAQLPAPPLTQPQPPSPARCHSFPPHSSPRQHHQAQRWVMGGSEESTPSITSSSSSRSSSPTPSSSPAESVVITRLAAPAAGDADGKCDSPIHHLGNYHTLLNRFCFYTGSGPDGTTELSDTIPRSFSASSVEEFLSGQSPPLGGSSYRSSSPFATPRAHGRVSAMASDDELQRSGSATPTGPTMRRLPHTPPTPLRF